MARKIARLTDRTIKAKTEKGYYADGDGLYLQVSATGAKSWIFRFKSKGKARDMGLGGFPSVSLSEARQKAKEAREHRDKGKDPIEQRAAAAAEERQHRWTLREPLRNAPRSASHRMRPAGRTPSTGNSGATPSSPRLPRPRRVARGRRQSRPLLKVIRAHLGDQDRDGQPSARSHRARPGAAKARGSRDGDIRSCGATTSKSSFPSDPRSHPSTITRLAVQRLPAFVARLRAKKGVTAPALDFTILTAVRTSEAIGAKFSEFDMAAKVCPYSWRAHEGWRRTIGCRSAIVLVAIVKELAATALQRIRVPGSLQGEPLSNMAMLMMLRDM